MSLHLRSREITRQNSSLVYSSTPFREHLMNKSRSTGDLDKSEREVLRSTLTGSSDHFQSTETVKSFDVSPQLVECRPSWIGEGISQTTAFVNQLDIESLKKENSRLTEQIENLGKTVTDQEVELAALRLSVVRLNEELAQSESTIHRLQDDLTSVGGVNKSSVCTMEEVVSKLNTLCHVVQTLCEEKNINFDSIQTTEEKLPTEPVVKMIQTQKNKGKNFSSNTAKYKEKEIAVNNSFQPLKELDPDSIHTDRQVDPVQKNRRQRKRNRRKTKNKKIAKRKIIILGDSQARNMSWHLQKLMPDREVVGFVRPGMALPMVLHGLEEVVTKEKMTKRDHLVLMGGTNDFHRKTQVDVPDEEIQLIKKLSLKTNIIMIQTPPRYDRGSATREGIKKFNQQVLRQLDGSDVISLPVDFGRKGLMVDRLHLSSYSKSILSNRIADKIQKHSEMIKQNSSFLCLAQVRETMV